MPPDHIWFLFFIYFLINFYPRCWKLKCFLYFKLIKFWCERCIPKFNTFVILFYERLRFPMSKAENIWWECHACKLSLLGFLFPMAQTTHKNASFLAHQHWSLISWKKIYDFSLVFAASLPLLTSVEHAHERERWKEGSTGVGWWGKDDDLGCYCACFTILGCLAFSLVNFVCMWRCPSWEAASFKAVYGFSYQFQTVISLVSWRVSSVILLSFFPAWVVDHDFWFLFDIILKLKKLAALVDSCFARQVFD